MRVLVTGNRNHPRAGVVAEMLTSLHGREGVSVVVHGDCPGENSIDYRAKVWAMANKVEHEAHPANWARGRRAGPERNKAMVDLGADIVLAFPYGDSPGTRGCIELAKEAGLPIFVFDHSHGRLSMAVHNQSDKPALFPYLEGE